MSWSAPTERTDGSEFAAADIAYYEIYYTANSTGDIEVVRVTDTAALSSVITDLRADTYHFSITVTDTAGQASTVSEAVEVIVR